MDFVPRLDDLERRAEPKPIKGEAVLASRERTAARKLHERKVMDEARRRDQQMRAGCAWPHCEYRPKRLRIEVAHERHRGMGGDPSGERTTRDTLLSYCVIHHRLYDLDEIDHEPITDQGTDGLLAFYRRHRTTGRMVCVAVEKRIGVPEMRT
jgi:hypothetical protein